MSADLCDTLGIALPESTSHIPTATEMRTLEILGAKMTITRKDASKVGGPGGKLHDGGAEGGADDDDYDEDLGDFHIEDNSKRILLYEGKVGKHTLNSLVPHLSKRHIFLCNDVLVCTKQEGGGKLFGSPETYNVRSLIWIKTAYINKNYGAAGWYSNPDEDKDSFVINAPDRPYVFKCDNQQEKKGWVQEIERAILNFHSGTRICKTPGWHLDAIRGTLMSHAALGNLKEIELIMDHSTDDIDVPDENGMCPIHWAALRGHLNVVNYLISKGADVDALNSGLNSPLLCAAAGGFQHVVQRLLSADADITVRNLKDMDVLFMAAIYGYRYEGMPEILKICSQNAVDFNRLDSSGQSVLHACAARNLPIQALVAAGADVNRRSEFVGENSDLTPLQFVCAGPIIPPAETLRNLMDSGANANVLNSAGQTPLMCIINSVKEDPSGLLMPGNESLSDTEKVDMCDPIMHFAQAVLPALMELVRKGAKLTDKDTIGMRDSFKEAVLSAKKSWDEVTVPSSFDGYRRANVKTIVKDKSLWMPDKKSNKCQLCCILFNYTNRKHHCRSCGTLVCTACSLKGLHLTTESAAAATPDRVCDSCFNYHIAHAQIRATSMRRKKSQSVSRVQSESSVFKSASSVAAVPVKAAQKSSGMSDTMTALEANHKQLQETRDKTEMLTESANEFNDLSKQILKQQKNKVGLF